jgi:acetoin utilization protein AcuB
VGALPVVDEQGYLKGILSVRDLLRAFINVLGIGQPGTLLCILVEEKVGQLKRIVDAITEENISFGSILVAHYWEEEKRAVFPYLLTMNVSRIKKKLEGMGFELLDPMKWYLDQLPKNE